MDIKRVKLAEILKHGWRFRKRNIKNIFVRGGSRKSRNRGTGKRWKSMDMEQLSIGLINDMYAESRNDECKYAELATQEDFDLF